MLPYVERKNGIVGRGALTPPRRGARLCPAKQPQKGLYTKKERRTFALYENSSLFFFFYLSSSGTYSLVCMMLW